MSTSRATDDDWQESKSCLKERTKFMFNNSLLSDVKFSVKCGDGGRQKVVVPAHKFLLAISSRVFFAMFYGEMPESRDIIELPDCTSESFLELLRFLYQDEVKLTGSNVIEVLYLAKKYMIPSLSEECSRFLRTNVNAQNVFVVLPGVRMYKETSAEEKCWEIVDDHTKEAISTEAFLRIDHGLLCSVLERDTLRANEVDVFGAADRWAAYNCKKQRQEATGENKRKILGDAIYLIRFPLMKEKQFASLVPKTNILSKEDSLEVLLNFNGATETPLKFSARARRPRQPNTPVSGYGQPQAARESKPVVRRF